MKIQILWMAVMTVAAGGLIPASAAWAQEKDEVPARATWRPQAPERPELPPGVERKEDAFKVERPKASLPGLEPDREEAEARVETAPAEAEVTSPTSVEPLEPENSAEQEAAPATADTGPQPGAAEPEPEPAPSEPPQAPASEPERTAAVSSPRPSTGQTPAERRPPSPIPGSAVQPDYPRDALLEGAEGYVTLEFTVTRQGGVSNVAITEARPEGVFEQAVRDAIRRWEFRPATENGRPVEQRVRHRFDFNLDR